MDLIFLIFCLFIQQTQGLLFYCRMIEISSANAAFISKQVVSVSGGGMPPPAGRGGMMVSLPPRSDVGPAPSRK